MPRPLTALAIALAVATCRDTLAPDGALRGGARLAVVPVLPSGAVLGEFGLAIDGVRFVVVRPAADTLADTTLAVAPEAEKLELDLRVPIRQSPETLLVSIIVLSGTKPLFAGTAPVEVTSRAQPTPTELHVEEYVGPGAGVDSIAIQPRDPFLVFDDSLRFQVEAFQGGAPVTEFYVAWSSRDPALAPINGFGVLRAPGARGSVRVVARTPSGASDSVTATFTPTAVRLVSIAGGGQTGIVGALLATPLEVEARAADSLGVGGVTVRFRPLLGGGAVTDTLVVTDASGRARTSATLGLLTGGHTFEARVTGLAGSPVTFSATALAGTATQLLAAAGDGQLATVATALPIRPSVRARDAAGNPVAGASVTFQVSGGGGNVSGAAQLTNAAGVATVGGWTLGTLAGPNTLTATVSGVAPVSFSATGLAGAAARLVKVAGDLQSAVVNTAVPTAPQVRIEDQYGNPVAGFTVTVLVDSASGRVTNPSPSSDSNGVASAESWQLGTLVGQNALAVSAGGLSGSPVTFTATGLVDVASQVAAFAGDGQAALVGTTVSIPPAVRVTDQFGNAIGGVAVTFTVTFGGGTIGLPVTVSSDTAGIATSFGWTLGTAGVNTLDATATGLPTVTFTADALASTATTILENGGTGQTGTVGAVLGAAYSVVVTDGVSPVPGVPVSWAVPAGSGSISPALDTTDATGIASAIRTLGTVAGTQTATASVGGLTGSPVVFTATALPDVPAAILRQSPNPQSGTVATAVAAPAVKVVDQHGNAVAGVIVGFAVTGGGGVGAATDTTDGSGLATAGTWTLGQVAGTNTVTVTSGTLPPVGFTATGVAGAPAMLAFLTEPGRSLAGDTIDPAPRVAIKDQFGNIVTGATDMVSLKIGAAPDPDAMLVGTLAVGAVGGIATFGDIFIDSAGPGYTLDAMAGPLSMPSQAFDVGGVVDAATSDGLDPVAAAFSPATGLVCVPGASRALGVLDPSKVEFTQFPILQSAPFGAAVNTSTNRLYVTTLAGVAVVIDCRIPPEILTPVLVGGEARGIAVDEVTNRIYIAVADPLEGTGTLVPIDGSQDVVVTGDVVELPAPGVGVAFNPNDGLVYVAIPSRRSVVVIDPKPGSARIVADLGGGLGKGIYGVAVDGRTHVLYATNRDENTVSVIDISAPDPNDFREIQRLAVGRLPEGLGVDAERGVVYVANSGDNTISLIDAQKFTVFATLVVGPTPKAAAVDPTTGRVYVPTFEDSRVRVVQP